MKKRVSLSVGLLLALLATACGPTPASPTATALPRRTTTRPANAPTDTPAPAEASSVPGASPSQVPMTPIPTSASTPMTPIPTSTPAPPTPVIPSGLYATTLDIVPDPPTRGSELIFYATFANTTGVVQNFRWITYIYRSDNRAKAFGQTTATSSSVAIGAHTEKSLGHWTLPLGGPCEDFVARVVWMDQNNQTTPFLRPDGQPFERAFTVCAQTDLPTATPAPPRQPTSIPTPGAGLFVTDLRTDPNPPTRGSDLYFYPAFSNTTGTNQNYRWLVYVYRSDNPATAFGQTSALQTAFPAGASEQRSLGSWKLALGGPCEDYVARVTWLDQNNKPNQFTRPNGTPFEKNMTICPP